MGLFLWGPEKGTMIVIVSSHLLSLIQRRQLAGFLLARISLFLPVHPHLPRCLFSPG